MAAWLKAMAVVLAIWGGIAVLLAACGVVVVVLAHLAWWAPLVFAAVPWFALAVMAAREL